jgi:hypothetical protein
MLVSITEIGVEYLEWDARLFLYYYQPWCNIMSGVHSAYSPAIANY